MNTITTWLSPARRKAIYAALASVGAVLVLAGVLTDAELAHYLELAGQALSAAGLLLAVVHTDTSTPTGEPQAEFDERQDSDNA